MHLCHSSLVMMIRWLSFLMVYFGLCPYVMQAQPDMPYQIARFSVSEGLPHNAVHALCQDHNGYLWVGTEAGLSRYNGYNFEQFLEAKGQRIGHVYSLFETPDGTIWAGSEAGIFIVIHNDAHPLLVTFGGGFKQVRDFFWDNTKHRLWFASASGPFYFTQKQIDILKKEPGDITQLPAPQPDWNYLMADDLRAFSIEMDNKMRLWVGNNRSLICCDGATCHQVWKSAEINEVTSLTCIGTDSLVFGGSSTTLLGYFKGRIWKYPDSMYYVTDLFAHHGKTFFFSAGEMYRIEDGKAIKIWDHPVRVGISDVIVDRENNVWIASWEGLIKISPRFFEQISLTEHPELDETYGIGEAPDGSIFLGANHGKAYHLENGPTLTVTTVSKQICPNANINDFYTDAQKRLWVATEYEGLALLSNGKKRLFGKKDGLQDEGIFALLHARNGHLWAIGDNGISDITISGKEKYTIKAVRFRELQEGLNTLVCAVEDPLGRIWAGGNRGLFKVTGIGLEQVFLDHKKDIIISGMSTDAEGRLWIATLGNGLICCTWAEKGWQIAYEFTELNGLFSNNLLAVLSDTQGRVWIGYGSGIGLLENGFSNTCRIRFFNHRHGFFQKGYRRMKIFEAKNGTFWVTSPVGVCTFRPDAFVHNNIAPVVRIRYVELLNAQPHYMTLCDSFNVLTGLPENLTLSYGLNDLHFVFDGLSLTNPENNRFQFMLEGADEYWRTPDNGQLQATYPNLQPGDYTFHVNMQNSDGIFALSPATFHFKINAPIWQKLWFWCAAFLLSICATLYFARTRIRRVRQQESEKTRVLAQIAELKVQALRAKMNPHFIFNCLAGIQECVLLEQYMEANDYLTRFSRLLRLTLELSDQSFISLREEMDMLRLYLDLENTRLGYQIDYQINTHRLEEDFSIQIPTFILQPFVENAIWHGLMHQSGQKKLSIDVSMNDSLQGQKNKKEHILTEAMPFLIIDITDNGIGRARSTEIKKTKVAHQQSKGIQMISERLRLLHPDAQIIYTDLQDANGVGSGTIVHLEIPML